MQKWNLKSAEHKLYPDLFSLYTENIMREVGDDMIIH